MKFLTAWFVLTLIFILFMSILAFINYPEAPESSQESFSVHGEEWCLVQSLPPSGGDISVPSAGTYEYLVVNATSSVDFYHKCSKIE